MALDGPSPREFVASLLARPPEVRPGLSALPVPDAPADEVIAVARRLALRGLPGEHLRPNPPAALLRLATALVVDEHPSASSWLPADRALLAAWVSVLIDRDGEEGVEEFVRALDRG
ncbi:hypothetical protein [Kitasatospora sp. KL5]|uniref:hypothetical protein n=1 Tax=Kitasatospora sp. KL5 TaxID=3425125 RepID=UPI003D6F4579